MGVRACVWGVDSDRDVTTLDGINFHGVATDIYDIFVSNFNFCYWRFKNGDLGYLNLLAPELFF